jgi:hypothetical protein
MAITFFMKGLDMDSLDEWAGSLLGLLGAALLATHSSLADWGFVAFLFSNFCFIAFAMKRKFRGLLAMQVGFTATSILGIVNGQF